MEKFQASEVTQSETVALENNLSFQGRSEMRKTVEDLTLFVATMSNVSSFAREILSSPKRIEPRNPKRIEPQNPERIKLPPQNPKGIYFQPRSNIAIKTLNPVVPPERIPTTTDEIQSKQSETAAGFSLVGSLTSAVPLFATSLAVATVAALLGRAAALWNLPGNSSLHWLDSAGMWLDACLPSFQTSTARLVGVNTGKSVSTSGEKFKEIAQDLRKNSNFHLFSPNLATWQQGRDVCTSLAQDSDVARFEYYL